MTILLCRYCLEVIHSKSWTLGSEHFCNRTCYLRWRWGIPTTAVEVDGIRGAIVGHSELAIYTHKAGSFVSRLWSVNDGSYGYAVLKGDKGFLHGSLTIHDPHSISLS